MNQVILVYLLVMNFMGYFMMKVDKARAKAGKWRISENRLLLCALLGGSIGSLIGMVKFHHKTKHPRFYIGIPAMLIFHVEMLIFYVVVLFRLGKL